MLKAQSLGRYSAKHIYKWVQNAHIHQMLGAIIIIAHASEIMRVVEHIKIWHIAASLLLFAIWLSSERDHDAELA
jgi:nitrate reductase gamma subunit